jgi:DNA-binding IclR family transcriptional regulator
MTATHNDDGMVDADRTLFTILDGIKELGGAGVTELAEFLELPKSSIHRHLKTLEAEEMVINDEGHYQLSFRFLEYGGYVRDSYPLYRVAQSKAYELGRETDELATFAMEENDHGVFVLSSGDDYNRNPLGKHFHLHQNATGKSMLAKLSDDQIDSIIERQGLPAATDATITTRDALFDEIEQIRDRGYALNLEERTESICAVGASVYDEENDQLGALSLAMPRNQVTKEELQETYATKILAAVDELSLRLRYD